MQRLIQVMVLSMVAAASVAHAQMMGGMTPQQQTDMMNFQSAMVKAQTAAMKPGDEVLTCDALRRELVAVIDSPAIKAYAAKTNAAAAQQFANSQKTGAQQKPMSAATAALLAQSLSPDMGAPGMAGLTGMPSAAQLAQAQKMMIDQMTQMTPVLPALMRSQRLMMLSGLKQCGMQ